MEPLEYVEIDYYAGVTGWTKDLFKIPNQENKQRIRKVLMCGRSECRSILKDPWQLECGHRFCKDCLEEIIRMPEEERICELCMDDLFSDDATLYGEMNSLSDVQTYYPDRYEEYKRYSKINTSKAFKDQPADKEVKKLFVYCPYGCGLGSSRNLRLRELENHLRSCELRIIECPKCGERFKFTEVGAHHRDNCTYREVTCPFGCNTTGILAKDLEAHQMKDCAMKAEACKICNNLVSGNIMDHLFTVCPGPCPICNKVGGRGFLGSHFSTNCDSHLELLGDFVYKFSGKEQEAEGSDGSLEFVESMNSVDYGRELSSLMSRLFQVESRLEKSTDDLVKMSTMSVSQVKKLLKAAAQTHSNRETLVLLEKLIVVLERDVTKLTSYVEVFGELQKDVLLKEDAIADQIRKLDNDSCVREEQNAEHQEQISLFGITSYTGKLIWRVDDVAELIVRAREGTQTSVYSQPFFTDRYGYKMCLRLFPNGDGNGKGSHMSLFFVLMKGDYDPVLEWPFSHQITFTLRHQQDSKKDITEKFRSDPTSESFKRPMKERNIGSGCPLFVRQELVYKEEGGYLVDDVMYIEVSVSPVPLDPPHTGDGNRKGSHMSLFFVLMKGDYDPILEWPLSHQIITLWNQQDSNKDKTAKFHSETTSDLLKLPKK